jgi:adenylosuccinate lyase
MKLPVSRWQRDLTDSTVHRNFGVALGHVVIAIQSTLRGLKKLQANPAAIARDVNEAWEVLGEAIQTVMRRHGIAEPYEKLSALTRGKQVNRELLHKFIETLDIPAADQRRLLDMTPASYTGIAALLARKLS